MIRPARRVVAAAIFMAVALVPMSCGGSDRAADAPALALTMRDLSFDPATIALKRGERVRLDMRNAAQQLHDFTLQTIPADNVRMEGSTAPAGHDMQAMGAKDGPVYDLHIPLEGGKDGRLEFRPTEAGEYEYFCTVPGHREAGMRGVLRVE